MSVARAWLRELAGASGVSLVVPAAIVVALVLLGVGGAFGDLRALGQALAGPGVPREVTAVGASRTASAATPPLVGGGRAASVAGGARVHAVARRTKDANATTGSGDTHSSGVVTGLGGGPGTQSAGAGASSAAIRPGSAAATPASSPGATDRSSGMPGTSTAPSPGAATAVARAIANPVPPSRTKRLRKVTGQPPPLPGLP